jgi:hypothetical protein
MASKGFTLIEVLVGSALCLVVFLGIFGCYQLGLKVLGQSKARIIASAIATEQIEKMRSLPYYQVGTYECKEAFPECDPTIEAQIIPGYPQGLIKKSEQFTRNSIEFTIDSVVEYGINCSDGVGAAGLECPAEADDACPEIPCPEDECPNDYKKIKIQVSWSGRFGGTVVLDSLAGPVISEQECQEKGGFLVLTVYDAYGSAIVPFPEITVENTETSEIKTALPEDGRHTFVLAPGSALYKLTITKSGYTQEQTFKSNDFYQGTEVINTLYPYGNPNISEGQIEERTYYIDEQSNFNIQTLSPESADRFVDTFVDETKISEKNNIDVFGGQAKLQKVAGETYYHSSGYLISHEISSAILVAWNNFYFSDNEPQDTSIVYQILFYDSVGEIWDVVPGFGAIAESPVDLSGLDIVTYPKLKIRGDFTTTDTDFSPLLEDWQITWTASASIPVGDVSFALLMETDLDDVPKIIGTDSSSDPIYKYEHSHSTNSSGILDLSAMEFGKYVFSDFSVGGSVINLRADLSPQPVVLGPGTTQAVELYLEAMNSLLVQVGDKISGNPISLAPVKLSNAGLSYDKTQFTDSEGRTLFIPLESDTYNLEVVVAGYATSTDSVAVSGSVEKIVEMETE